MRYEPPANRDIFEYHNGKDFVRADPLIIEGRFRIAAVNRGTTIDAVIDGANLLVKDGSTEEEKAGAYQATEMLAQIATEVLALRLAPHLAEALGIQTEPGSADLAHAIGIVDFFYRELEKKNRRGVSPPASMPSTASTSATPQTTNT